MKWPQPCHAVKMWWPEVEVYQRRAFGALFPKKSEGGDLEPMRDPEHKDKIPYGVAKRQFSGEVLEGMVREGSVAPDPDDKKYGVRGNNLRKALLAAAEEANRDESFLTESPDWQFGVSIRKRKPAATTKAERSP